jgi:hypothetical protein
MNNESLLTVVSVRGINPRLASPDLIYIGRRAGNWAESPLANPFKLTNESDRPAIIEQYGRYLWTKITDDDIAVTDEIARIARMVQGGHAVLLGCWCSPLACHGDAVKQAVLWWLKKDDEWDE